MGGAYDERRLNSPQVAEWRYELTANGLPIAFRTIPFFLMGNAAIHRSVFDEIGLFDEALGHGGEEVDFAARAFLAGIEIGWVPDAVIYYRHRTTIAGLSAQFFDYGRATRYVYARYRDRAALPRTGPGEIAQAAWAVLPHVVNLARGSRRRGEWIRISSFYAGETVEAIAQLSASFRRNSSNGVGG
jgi:GT2 family glycosyltransferase